MSARKFRQYYLNYIIGSVGEKGMRGNPGLSGKPGDPGAPGSDGMKGESGSPGTNGFPGRDGIDGRSGTPGKMGIYSTCVCSTVLLSQPCDHEKLWLVLFNYILIISMLVC